MERDLEDVADFRLEFDEKERVASHLEKVGVACDAAAGDNATAGDSNAARSNDRAGRNRRARKRRQTKLPDAAAKVAEDCSMCHFISASAIHTKIQLILATCHGRALTVIFIVSAAGMVPGVVPVTTGGAFMDGHEPVLTRPSFSAESGSGDSRGKGLWVGVDDGKERQGSGCQRPLERNHGGQLNVGEGKY